MKHIPNVHYNNILCDPKVKMTCSFTETITLMLKGKIFFTPTFFTFQFIFKKYEILYYVPGHI